MNTILNNLREELDNIFAKFDIDESVQISISKITDFDIQINNLVKYKNHKSIQKLQKVSFIFYSSKRSRLSNSQSYRA